MSEPRFACGPARIRRLVIGAVVCAMTALSAVAVSPPSAFATTDGPGSIPEDLVTHDGFVWFAASDGALTSLYKSDGTSSGTTLVASGVDPESLTWIGNRLFFQGEDPALNDRQLFVSDGTEVGTKPITAVTGGLQARDIVAFRGGVLFTGQEDAHGQEPWFSNGKVGGTHLIRDIVPGVDWSQATAFTVVGNGATAVFGAQAEAHGEELWRTDGTKKGTMMVKDIDPGTNWGFADQDVAIMAYRHHAYFLATNGVAGYELWTTNGTSPGTHMVKNIGPGATDMTDGDPEIQGSQSNYLDAAIYRGDLWFAANDGKHGNELWRTNGTAKGTTLALDVIKGQRGADPEDLTAVGGHLLFDAQDVKHGEEPWSTRGSAASTHRIGDVWNGPQSSFARDFVAVPSGAVFIAYDPKYGYDLWHSTLGARPAGLVKDIYPGSSGAGVDQLTRLGSKVVFTADDGIHGDELWVTDGNGGHTHLVKDLNS